jgi:hypothetical protein
MPKRRGRGSGGVTGKGFMPGQSGNPGGQSKLLQEIRELARTHAEAALDTLRHMMLHGRPDSVRVVAAQALWDRAWGRPHQSTSVQMEGAHAIYVVPPSGSVHPT